MQIRKRHIAFSKLRRQSRCLLHGILCLFGLGLGADFAPAAFAWDGQAPSAAQIQADAGPVSAGQNNAAADQGVPAADEKPGNDEKSWFLSFVESRLSAPNRRIALSHIEGALSSKAAIGSITIADRQGIWLEIHNAKLDWNRLALLRGRVSVNSLSADSIEILRKPLPNPQEISVKAETGFSLPHLPLGIKIDSLKIGKLLLGEEFAGQAAEVSLEGRLQLENRLFDVDVAAKRLDNAGGDFKLAAHYGNTAGDLTLDSYINEPANGILANMLDIEGRPPLHFTVQGGGTGGALKVKLHMEAAARPILDGLLTAAKADKAQTGDSQIFSLTAGGPIAALMPAAYRPFFGAKTGFNLQGAVKAGGGFRIDKFLLDGDSVYLSGQAETAADGFLRRLALDGALGRNAGAARRAGSDIAQSGAVILPVKGGTVKLDALRLNIDYGAARTDKWSGRLSMENMQSEAAAIGKLNLIMGGAAENLDNAAARHISAAAKGGLYNIALKQAGGGTAAVPQVDIALDADWRAGQALAVHNADINGGGLLFSAQGAIENRQFNGKMRFVSTNIADFAKIFGQNLAGSVNLALQGAFGLGNGVFDTDISGGFNGLRTGNAGLNGLLRSDIAVSGGLARDVTGMSARNLRLANGQIQLFANGNVHEDRADLDFGVNLADMALLVPFIDGLHGKSAAADTVGKAASGALTLRGAARGHNRLIAVALQAGIAEGMWNGRILRNLHLDLNSVLDNSARFAAYRSGIIRGDGMVGADRFQLNAAMHQSEESWRLDNIKLILGETALDGFLQKQRQGLWNGNLIFKADNIAPLAALAFMEGKGKADITVNLKAEPAAARGRRAVPLAQNLVFKALADGLIIGYPPVGKDAAAKRAASQALVRVDHLEGEGRADDIFALPQINGSLKGQTLRYGPYGIDHFTIESRGQEQNSAIQAQALLTNGMSLAAAGAVAPIQAKAAAGKQAGNWQFVLQNLAIRGLPALTDAAASQPTNFEHLYNSASPHGFALDSAQTAYFTFAQSRLLHIEGLALNISRNAAKGGNIALPGFVKLDGSLADRPDITVSAQNLPLALANLVRPGLGLRGILTGAAHIQGQIARPILDFDLNVKGAGSAALAQAGLAPVNVRAKGQTQNDVLTVDALLAADRPGKNSAAAQQEIIRVSGQIFPAARKLHLNADIKALPLGILQDILHNPVLAQQNLRGLLNARAVIGGSFTDPQIQFSARAERLAAHMLTMSKAAPLDINAEAVISKQAVRLNKLALQGPGNVQFAASGRLPFAGSGLDLQAKGNLPLAVANNFLQAQGAQLGGLLAVDAHIGGSLQNPQMRGNFAVRQGQFLDAPLNLRLKPIEIAGRLQGSEIVFDKAALYSPSGGVLNASGALGLSRQADFPVRLQMNFNRFSYNDGSTVAAKLDGALTIGGAILRGMDIGGKIKIDKAEIRVPDSFGGAAMLDIANKHITAPIARTQKRAGVESGKTGKAAKAEKEKQARILPRLNIQISAPNQIFVRGRGLDAEMGGQLQLTGRLDNMRPSGGFNLIRGRFDILAQRLIFRQGQVSLAGSLNPDLYFVAVSNGDDVTVTIIVSGTPKNLKISLSSDPVLPQDEILARLIFKRSLGELSPLQVAQLVDATAELTGVTSHSLLGGLRSGAGLDQLDIITDAAGNAGVSAGRYIMNKLYLGVETSAGGASKGTVNLDITRHLKAKGAIGSDSNSNIGVFYEKDY